MRSLRLTVLEQRPNIPRQPGAPHEHYIDYKARFHLNRYPWRAPSVSAGGKMLLLRETDNRGGGTNSPGSLSE